MTTATIHANYGFIITTDVLEGNDAIIIGPRGIDPAIEALLHHGQGRAFRLHDDDELYYEGRYIGPDDDTEFAPLDDYGTPNAGATSISYQNPLTGHYQQI
jgi:hypothetical protein